MGEELDKRAVVRMVCAAIGGIVIVVAAFVFGFIEPEHGYEGSFLERREVILGYGLYAFVKVVLAFCGGAWLGYNIGDEVAKQVYKK